MSNYSSLYGAGGVPIGAIVQGQFAADASYLPCDGRDYLSASYPLLDKTSLSTFGTNVGTIRTMFATSGSYSYTLYAASSSIGVTATINGGTTVYTTTDGVTWTARTLPTSISITDLQYLGGKFIIFGLVAPGAPTVITSTDGITWTQQYQYTGQPYSANFYGTQIAYSGSLYVAIVFRTSGGSDHQMYFTSPDGVTWTARSFPTALSWSYCSFIGDRFFVTNISNSNTYKSTDGINWYTDSTPGSATSSRYFNYNGVTYCNSYRSYNNGATWVLVSGGSTPTGAVNGILFYPSTYYGYEKNYPLSQPLPISVGTAYSPSMYYSGPLYLSSLNRIVCGNISGGYYNTATSWDLDTTKFKTPLNIPAQGTDLYYIKAK